jgi:hypothetical protein
LRLPNLLIQVGRLHIREKLSGGNAVSDVHIAMPYVALGARQDGRFRYSLNVPREHQLAHRGAVLHRDHGDIGQRVIVRAGFGDNLHVAAMMGNIAA